MPRKRRDPVTITAFAPALRTAPRKPVFAGEPRGSRSRYCVAALVVVGLAAVAGVVRSAALRSSAGAVVPDRPFVAEASGQRDVSPPLASLQQDAAAGVPEAQLELGIRYARGEAVGVNYAVAAKWFRAAAEQGLTRAQFDMGVLYQRGQGVQIDPVEAASWYLKAAEKGYPLAEYNLAVFYAKGEGFAQDLPEAASWYRRAAVHGVVQAMANLAEMYDKNLGVPGSRIDAYAWYLAAAARGDHAARQRADEIAAALSPTDRQRAKLLASDVAASIEASPEMASQFGMNAEPKPLLTPVTGVW